MNRILGWFSLDGNLASYEKLEACPFQTPHWQPDHQAIFVEKTIALSAIQRFITPQCPQALMPYQHLSSGCIINADVYLTNRERLCQLLRKDLQTADAVLILDAYLKWGMQCTKYLSGQFCFVIWDPRHQHLYMAVDPFAQCPIFYIHQPNHFFMLANECSSFHILYPQLRLNKKRLQEFALDKHSQTETAYQQILKLPAGHQLVVTKQFIRKTCYWSWTDHKQILPYHTREEFYEAFQHYFERAVQVCTRRIGGLSTQISGGLDSSAITAQTALLLNKKQESLFAFTSIPYGLNGESFRPGWYYHELSRIQALMNQYPNIHHVVYTATPDSDIFEKLKPLQPCFDQPLRNINNLDWNMASYEQVLAEGGRVLLIGAGGNGSISWAGTTLTENFKSFCSAVKSKILRRPHYFVLHPHQTMLSGHLSAPLRASVYALQLWYGVRRLDPTQELDLAIFCYNVPQWIYRQGKHPLEQRLLVRQGLRNLLPEEITQNPYRGEQGADWYLHYNIHAKKWCNYLQNLSPQTQEILWQSYDHKKIMNLFKTYHVIKEPPDRKITKDLCLYLLRCLSVAFYLDQHL